MPCYFVNQMNGMRKDTNIKSITSYFARISTEINNLNSLSLYDINKICETICIPVLREIYSCPELINLNVFKENYPAIDLGCSVSKISFQITSDNSSTKVKETLTKYHEHELNKKFDKVYVFILTNKQKSYTSKPLIEIAKQLEFDLTQNIIDFRDLLTIIESKETALSDSVLNILNKEFSKIDKFSLVRDELNILKDISLIKIDNEKRTKKYIPNIYSEPTQVKDKARIFSNPIFFYRKILLQWKQIDFSVFNNYMDELGQPPIKLDPDIFHFDQTSGYDSFITFIDKLDEEFKGILAALNYYNGYSNETYSQIKVPAVKEKLKSVIRYGIAYETWPIINKIEEILADIRLIKSNVLLITSLAGQGKTNFLCDFAENFCTKFDIPFVYIPARELNNFESEQIIKYIKNNKSFNIIKDKFEFFEFAEIIAKKINLPFVFIIDGINEIKNSDTFKHHLIDFIQTMMQYKFIKLIVTCRSEFFDKKFNYLEESNLKDITYRVNDLKKEFSPIESDRILKAYLFHFNIKVMFSTKAKDFLLENFLLLRIFCESNEGNYLGQVDEIYKVELFENYLIEVVAKQFDHSKRKMLVTTLFKLADLMLSNDNYINISLSDESLEQENINIIEQLVNDDIILRRELPVQSLIDLGSEQVNFTYDELRDFIIAYYLLHEKNDEAYLYELLNTLESKPSHEGIIKYLYLLSREKDNPLIVSIIERLPCFYHIYSLCIFSLNDCRHKESDIDVIYNILNNWTSDIAAFNKIAMALLCRRKNKILNINLLNDFLNNIDDSDYEMVIPALFCDYYYEYNDDYKKLNKFIKSITDWINKNIHIDIDFIIFAMQVSVLSSSFISRELINATTKIDESTLVEICEYLKNSKSVRVVNLAQAITEKNKNV